MLKKITKWETEDGKVFDTQEDAEDYMFEQDKEVMTHHTEAERVQQVRHEFEAWCRRRGIDVSTKKDAWGREYYSHAPVSFAWLAWEEQEEAHLAMAARRAPAAQVPQGGELSLLARIRKEIDHAVINDHRMPPAFGRRIGDPCVRISHIKATIEGWEKSTAPQSPAEASMISSREVVSKPKSGLTVTRLNLSEAGRAALQSKATHIPVVSGAVSAPAELPEPALYVSGSQLEKHCDPEDTISGSYIPARKTAAGLFTASLYTEQQVIDLLKSVGVTVKP